MEKKINYTLKWHRNWDTCVLILFFGGVFCITMLALMARQRALFLALFCAGFAANIIFFLYACLFGFNSAMYLDGDKIYSKIHGKRYEWTWSEMTEIESRLIPFRSPLRIIKITTDPKYKKLIFDMDRNRYKTFMEICPNESIKAKLKALVETDD